MNDNMKPHLHKIVLISILLFAFSFQDANAQRLRKVWASKKVVAYDADGNKIDSLTKDLRTQGKRSRYLDQIQVDLHQIELAQKKAEGKGEKAELNKKRQELLDKRIALIQEIKNDKELLVTEYYLVAGSFKKKKNAKKALAEWDAKGYKPFMFKNKYRKWYYVCLSVHRSYRKVNLKQWNLQKEGIDTWIYYWSQ